MAKRITQTPPVLELPAEMLTIDQAATRIGMSDRYVRRAIAERRIAAHHFGRSVRIDPADLAAFVHESRVEPMTAETVWRGLRSVA
ncbi:helix-turn-helix domain-containing protein [Paractinoplanes globisporus]|uniref:Helix-turn-helix domain-containing protein n=1 Tax=Paractinoplanes globisporus TaxID=113565 RepID=A0ABW6WNX4_9ACTN|nr:helix-turn-helix domain-containing protein [Actinoplanes globisporus]